ncbi:MAG TPA: UDP-N-acetylmuramoyl-L-alanyl-D-glutamate--2,6-diaminopimelate ligase [Dermatophilaceae bacterium]|nr:UDP-N-acetylmuramoyl-L-alanyl-D-glutamate--2,6-diaminopimelate ligase [Dermatophilaceae bacterium]
MAAPRPASLPTTTARALADLVGARASRLPDPLPVTGVVLDSRAVRPGDLYAALPGSRAHGADFVGAAVAAGAVAVLTDERGAEVAAASGPDVPVLVVDDPRAVLGTVSARVYGTEDSPVRMVGVTGTNGKTTTAYLLRSALDALGHRTGLIGTVETCLGEERVRSVRTTPEAPDLHALLAVMAERRLDTCVMEVSSHALAQHRVDGVVFDVALFTNLSQDHLDFHGTMEEYFAAKAGLFTPQRARAGLVCVDDEWGRALKGRAGVPVTTLTTRPDRAADWTVTPVAGDPAAFTLASTDLSLHLRSTLPGDFNVTNTAMAAVALLLTGERPEDVRRAVLSDPHVPGRMERVAGGPASGGAPSGVVDYAHTAEAVAAALGALRPATEGRLVVVLGAGGDRDRGKRRAMGEAAARGADVVVVTDDNPRSEQPSGIRAALLDGARAGGTAVEVLEVADRRAAIRRAVAEAAVVPGSVVAVVGKGHETGQDVAGLVSPFDDRVELRAALDALATGGLS